MPYVCRRHTVCKARLDRRRWPSVLLRPRAGLAVAVAVVAAPLADRPRHSAAVSQYLRFRVLVLQPSGIGLPLSLSGQPASPRSTPCVPFSSTLALGADILPPVREH